MQTNWLYRKSERYCRVIFYNSAAGFAVAVFFTNKKIDLPRIINQNELDEIKTTYDSLQSDYLTDYSRTITDTEEKRCLAKLEIIKPLIRNEPDIYDANLRYDLIKSLVEVSKHSKKTIYSWLKLFWMYRGKEGLYSQYHNCGNSQKNYSKTPGPESEKRGNKYLVTEADKANIKDAVSDHLKKNLDKSFYNKSQIFRKLIAEKYTDIKLAPSIAQFYYWLPKLFSKSEIIKRFDPLNYERNIRFLHGTGDNDIPGPGYEYQMDATRLRIEMVSSFDCNQAIGNALLFLIIDTFSRYIIGYYLGLENESYGTGNLALLNAFSDKSEILSKYNLGSQWRWEKGKIPVRLLADKGRHFSTYADALTENLDIEVANTTAYRPDLKGLVEIIIKTIKKQSAHLVNYQGAGVSIKDNVSRVTENPKNKAISTLEICDEVIVRCIIAFNHSTKKGYALSEKSRKNGIQQIPADIFNFYRKQGWEYGKDVDEDYLKKSLLYNEERSYHREGIIIKGIDFIPTLELDVRRIETFCLNKGSNRFKIFFNPKYFNEIYLRFENEFIPLIPRQFNNRWFQSFYELAAAKKKDGKDKTNNDFKMSKKQHDDQQEIEKKLEKIESVRENSKIKKSDIRVHRTKEVNKYRKELSAPDEKEVKKNYINRKIR